ncbi:hypothetical protein SUGI_0333960 [Cryptomeria japonica]|nr:hypothetical protein SUGI_0333960 [Cryptomeria japonica]
MAEKEAALVWSRACIVGRTVYELQKFANLEGDAKADYWLKEEKAAKGGWHLLSCQSLRIITLEGLFKADLRRYA